MVMGGRGGSAMIARLTERTQCRDLGESKRANVIVMDIVLLASLGFSRGAEGSGALIGIARLDDKAFDIRPSGEHIKRYRIAPGDKQGTRNIRLRRGRSRIKFEYRL